MSIEYYKILSLCVFGLFVNANKNNFIYSSVATLQSSTIGNVKTLYIYIYIYVYTFKLLTLAG